ncbi:MerR family DNA-binding protein [Amycolatopsis thermophila]|uniref:MerR family DNA-binding protein n=1 Tax=Amycolatopsis thermophila TaxID=206084 RepID=UPI003521EF25
MRELGVTLDEMRDLLRVAAGGPEDCEAASALAHARLARFRRRRHHPRDHRALGGHDRGHDRVADLARRPV